MLARQIPKEIQDAMCAPDAIDLGFTRNYPALIDGPGSPSCYPGWGLIRKHLAIETVVAALNSRRNNRLRVSTWEELDALHRHSQIIEELMATLARTLKKTIFVTRVHSGEDGVYYGIQVLQVNPDGLFKWTSV